MGLTNEDWKTLAAVLSAIAQVTAAIAAGAFFCDEVAARLAHHEPRRVSNLRPSQVH
ncbi:MAG: hypothetical protein KUA37_06625 [Desulfomicrobium sp.]|nr:hypothetical protein [Pseudomonadota bacterium]MBV1711666.1 hypothetical protein [Desulfomicrobium sp.]MBU4569730.1 hypothetical protein [Pseudomonadota bacterium]MBU4595450.1 hypothetical protein [Pseudomonadota bacterium]MBV1718741.1 hypothetical protein [Desulfomicrobium sp.]